MEEARPRYRGGVGWREGVGKWLPRVVRLLWSQGVDDDLYTDSNQGDEDQSPSHCLVTGVEVAADGEEYGSQGEQQHA
jgi:hypothetical protein